MDGQKAREFILAERAKGRTYGEIATALKAKGYKGATNDSALYAFGHSKAINARKKERMAGGKKEMKIVIRRKSKHETPAPVESKVLLVMCSISQAKEILG
jgi:hypothetical protein